MSTNNDIDETGRHCPPRLGENIVETVSEDKSSWKQALHNKNQEEHGLCIVTVGTCDAVLMTEVYEGQAKVVLGPYNTEVPLYHGTPSALELLPDNELALIQTIDPSKHRIIAGVVSLVSKIDQYGKLSLIA